MKTFCSCQMLRNRLTTDTKVLYPKNNKKYGNALAHKISFHFSVDTLKLRFSEKATKFEKISHLFWHLHSNVKTSGWFYQIV